MGALASSSKESRRFHALAGTWSVRLLPSVVAQCCADGPLQGSSEVNRQAIMLFNELWAEVLVILRVATVV